jgi:hypothetical protein
VVRLLLTVLGVDYRQWRTLTGVMLKNDLRGQSMMQSVRAGRSSGPRAVLLTQGFFYGIMGVFLLTLAFLPDVFVGAVLMLTALMFFVGAMVLVEYQSVVVSPDDYAILGFQPVSSRTYFAVKLTNVVIYAGVIASLLGLPWAVAHLARGGIGRGAAALAAVYGAMMLVTLAMIVAYALVLHVVHPKRLRRALSYLQMLLGIVMYGGYALLPQLVDPRSLDALKAGDKRWILLYPPAWFASFLDIAAGHRGVTELLPALAGVVSVIALLWYSTERLSLSYAERLATLMSTAEGPARGHAAKSRATGQAERKTQRRRWGMLHGETRAMALLMRAQFRYDMKFRMAVLGIVPITVLYVFLSLKNGSLPDPFVDPGSGGMQGLGMLHLAAFFLPALLLESVARSDSFRAAWVFFATPADKPRLVLAAKNVIAAFVGIPYLLFLCGIFAWFFATPWHAVVHALLLGLFANLFIQASVAMRPQIPFARPVEKGRSSTGVTVLLFVTIGVVIGILPFLFSYLYAAPARIVTAVAVLVFANVAAGNFARRRAGRLTAELQFSN